MLKQVVVCMGLGLWVGNAVVAADPVKKLDERAPKPSRASPNVPVVHRDQLTGDQPQTIPPSDVPATINSNSAELKPVPVSGRKRWEAMLSQPADLDFGDRKAVSVKELLDQLRDRHEFSMRIDTPTFTALFGTEKTAREPKPAKRNLPATAMRNSKIRISSPDPQAPIPIDPESPKKDVKASPKEGDGQDAKSDDDSDQSAEAILRRVRRDRQKAKSDSGNDCDDESSKEDSDEGSSSGNIIDGFLNQEVNIEMLDLKRASVATVLRQTLDALPTVLGEDLLEVPFPISFSNACLLDYLVEDDGYLITTRMTALSQKETRVYSIKQLKDLNAEQVAKVIRQTIRPWSWRSQVNDLGDQLRGGIQLPPEMVKSIVTSGVQLAAAEIGATVQISEDEKEKEKEKSAMSDAEQLSAIGNATINGLVAFAHASLSGIEMFHFGEFPMGTIQTIPGKLIVRQSQAAHREIADLLKQLAEE